MSILFMDSAHGGNGATKWTTFNSIGTSAGVSPSGRTAYSVPSGGGVALDKVFSPVPSLVVGFYVNGFRTGGGSNNSQRFQIFGDSGATLHLTIYGTSETGAVQVRRGGGNGVLLAESDAGVIENNVWQHVEVRATIADAGGRVEVWVDGAQVIDFTGDTKNGGTATQPDMISFRRGSSGSMLVSDIVISGSDTPIGPATVWFHLPEADGDNTDLTPASGSDNYAMVDENPPDGDTTYVSSDNPGDYDLYTLSDLPAGTWDVLAIQTVIDARTDDGGARNLVPVLKTNGSEARGASRAVAPSYSTYMAVFETNPVTESVWTPTEINTLQAGVEVD